MADGALTTQKPNDTVITVLQYYSDPNEIPQNCILALKKSLPTIPINSYQCYFIVVSEKGLKQQTKLKHMNSHLDGQDGHEESEFVNNPCPLYQLQVKRFRKHFIKIPHTGDTNSLDR